MAGPANTMKLPQMFEFRSRNAELEIPEERMNRVRQSYQRRLSDALEDIFHRACLEGDTRTAAGLFAVLEDLCLRPQQEQTTDRRSADDVLAKARAALERCRLSAGQNGKPRRDPSIG